ncbi:histidine kinase [Microbacterium sp. PRF11]|uniref:sensor histidine kinase n=1 Tax=Microbacterium sp. PRF11 TaxID=2962593 RepID=UPI00288286CE|nr:histidine kinase [Microbacterium sp. PRF11]MDT0116597.1 histidine kinase [Microbacterium sp. PRF11]
MDVGVAEQGRQASDRTMEVLRPTSMQRVLDSRRALLAFALIVFITTSLQVLSNPLAVVIDGTPWEYPVPLGVVVVCAVLACAAQSAALLLSGTRPGIAAMGTVLAYVAVVAALEVPNWVASMPFVVAVAMFLAAAQGPTVKTLAVLAVVIVVAVGGVFGWSLSTGASLGVIWAFLLQSTITFVAPVAGATALGIWWARRSRRVQAAEEAAALAARELEHKIEHARTQERGRIARELHDVAGQHLAGMLSLADAAVEIQIRDTRQAVELIADMRSEGRFASASLYAALRDLDAVDHSSVERTPDIATLPELISYWSTRGMRLVAEVQGDADDLPAAVSTAAYRAIQEALTNSAKHAPGATNAVDVVITPGSLRATVVNGPSGAEREASGSNLGLGWGLANMKDKLALLGGRMTASATKEEGWLVTIDIPLFTPSGPGTTP